MEDGWRVPDSFALIWSFYRIIIKSSLNHRLIRSRWIMHTSCQHLPKLKYRFWYHFEPLLHLNSIKWFKVDSDFKSG
jgi:hypothetical protein